MKILVITMFVVLAIKEEKVKLIGCGRHHTVLATGK